MVEVVADQPEPHPPDGGFGGSTVAGLARLAGVERSTVQAWMRKTGFPAKNPDETINPFTAGVWYGTRQAVRSQPIPDDEGLGDGDSPALELLRMQSAILKGYDVEERRGSLVPRDKVLDSLMEIASVLRQSHELIRHRFGNDAHEILEDAIRQATVLINERFGSWTDDDDESEAAEPG